MKASFRQVLHDTKKPRARTAQTRRRAEGGATFTDASPPFHRTNMSRSRVLQGLLLYWVLQTKDSPPFSLYCFSPYKAVAAPRCRTSPSLWPGGAPLSPGRSVSCGAYQRTQSAFRRDAGPTVHRRRVRLDDGCGRDGCAVPLSFRMGRRQCADHASAEQTVPSAGRDRTI